MKHSKAPPGFAHTQSEIARKEGVSKEAAGAILAHASRHASKSAKKHNPRLNRVHGSEHRHKEQKGMIHTTHEHEKLLRTHEHNHKHSPW